LPQEPQNDPLQGGQAYVDDAVQAITGGPDHELDADGLRSMMETAASDFDRRTAHAFGSALLDHLSEDPANMRLLEALVILGLAHPEVLQDARISLAVEGRRLAVLLERSGDVERAQALLEFLAGHMPLDRTVDQELAGLMRRNGNTDSLVERYLRRADLAVEAGRISEAIPWLQEVLLLDRTRRDVARMIRDLRYGEVERDRKKRRGVKVLVGLCGLCFLVAMGVAWNTDAARRYGDLPVASDVDLNMMAARLKGLESLSSVRPIWSGSIKVRTEQDRIHWQLREVQRVQRDEQVAAQLAEQVRLAQAEAARVRGLTHAERGDFKAALIAFREAIDRAPEEWDHLPQLQVDHDALVEHLGTGSDQ
jgi:tetratricopeptide (TPR) repeat protein